MCLSRRNITWKAGHRHGCIRFHCDLLKKQNGAFYHHAAFCLFETFQTFHYSLYTVLLLLVCCVIKVAIDLPERNKDETKFAVALFLYRSKDISLFFTVHVFLRQRKKVQVCVSVKNKTNKLYFILHTSLTKELLFGKLTRLSCWLFSCFSCSVL